MAIKQNTATIIQGEDRVIPLQAVKENGDPFDLTGVTQLAVKLPGKDGSILEKVLNNRKNLWCITIRSVAASTAYNVNLNGVLASYTSPANPDLATIRTGIINAINALTGGATASPGQLDDVILVESDVAGAGQDFTLDGATNNLLLEEKESSLAAGGVSIATAAAGKYNLDLNDAETRLLAVGEKQDFESIIDKGTERRIAQYIDALTVRESVFAD